MKTLTLALAAALALAPSAAAQKAQGKPWFSEVLLQAPAKLGGCAIGNFDPDSPGKEAAAVCENGMVFLVRQDGGGDWPWNGRRVAQAPGELIQCFAANVLSETEADELVVYGASRGREDDGGPGIAYLGALDERGLLELTPLLQDEALLHGGTLANLDPRHRGNEIVLGGFSKKLHVLHREGADWIPEVAVEMDAPIKAITPWRDGVAVGTTDGKLTLVQRVEDGWRSVLLEATGAGHARLAAFAGILLSARDDGGLLRVDTNFKTQRVFQGKEKLRGAALGDIDPFELDIEFATGGYDGRLIVLTTGKSGRYVPRTVYRDSDRLHHVTVGELDGRSPGLEVLACGYSGKLILAGYPRD